MTKTHKCEALAVVTLLLASCGSGGAPRVDRAMDAANAQIMADFPQIDNLEGFEITTRDMGGKWRISYGGGTGGIIVDVDKHTGQAVIVEVQQ